MKVISGMQIAGVTSISLLTFYVIIRFFGKHDHRITIHHRFVYVALLSIVMVDVMLFCQHGWSIRYAAFSILAVYLMATAYIDMQTLFVYRILNISVGIAGCLFVYFIGVPIREQLSGLLIYIVIILVETVMKGMGVGDAYTLMAIVPYMLLLNMENGVLMLLLENIILSNLCFLCMNIKMINWKKLKFKSQVAFTPAVAITTLLLVMLNGKI